MPESGIVITFGTSQALHLWQVVDDEVGAVLPLLSWLVQRSIQALGSRNHCHTYSPQKNLIPIPEKIPPTEKI